MSSLAGNKRARFDFDILETFEAGLSLLGTEVKAIRAGKAKLEGSYVVVRGGEAFLVGASIAAFQPINTAKSYDPERSRKLLLSQKELTLIHRQTEQAHLTAVPLSLYSKGGKIKLELALARGKKQADKRESIKSRDVKREIDRTLKQQ
jgi:SsrA-binding protein